MSETKTTGMICVPIVENNVDDAIKQMEKSAKIADIVEFRADFIEDIDEEKLEQVIKQRKIPIIVTIKMDGEGGQFKGTEQERLKLLKKAIELKAEYVDIDHDSKSAEELIKNKNKTKIIASFHDFKKTDETAVKALEKIVVLEADVAKIVTYANDITDNVRIFEIIEAAKNAHIEIIGLCMGELGKISRVLSIKLGALLTFASSETGKESAPGQLTVEELKKALEALK
ncbi:type I 3-dehydroquinate dehydratase [Nanoarchaeota archaeon]